MSSLVQVCTDRFYRTITGFSALIEKEWIALGHPFGLNMFDCTLLASIPVRILFCSSYTVHMFSSATCYLSSSDFYVYVQFLHHRNSPYKLHQTVHSCGKILQHSRPKACTATFLLFLDCVAQLIRLHPLSFEYSHYLLIALWDLSITGLAS